MSVANIFPSKKRNEKELIEREYKKKIKKLRNKLFKNPTKVSEFITEAEVIMDDGVKDGVITEKEKDKTLKTFSKDLEKMNKFLDKVRK